jgi:hypothetical protein
MTIVILWHHRVKLECRVPYMIIIETALLRVPSLECEVVDSYKFFGCKHIEPVEEHCHNSKNTTFQERGKTTGGGDAITSK